MVEPLSLSARVFTVKLRMSKILGTLRLFQVLPIFTAHVLQIDTFVQELTHDKTCFLHMLIEQRRRSAAMKGRLIITLFFPALIKEFF